MQIAGRPPTYTDAVLLDAAATVFHRRGFHEASMVDVAAEAGATKPTLYARFGTKEQLYDRVLERIGTSLVADLETELAGRESGSAEEASLSLSAAFFGWVRAHPTGFRLLFVDAPAPTGVDHRERALAALRGFVADINVAFLRRHGRRPGRATPLVAAYLVGVLQQGGLWALDNPDFDVAAYTGRFILGGLEAVG